MTATTSEDHHEASLHHQAGTTVPNSTTNGHISAEPHTIDDLIRLRAYEETCDNPLIAYPSSGSEYVCYSAKQVNRFTERAAQHYSSFIEPRRSSDQSVQVIGLLGLSDFSYLITFLALSKLGHTVLFLSTRISNEAYTALLTGTSATTLLVDGKFKNMAEQVKTGMPDLQVGDICERSAFDTLSSADSSGFIYGLDSTRETVNVAWIIHSSGSTGLPKPIYITHKAALRNYIVANPFMKGFITLPLFHAHGISNTMRAVYSKKLIYVYNASLPLASQHLIATLRKHDIEIFYSVPYALKLLSESDEGTRLLAGLKVVQFGGSPCPKPIGDKLVVDGVNLVSHYGCTEMGQLMTSMRPSGDKDWDYVRPSDLVRPYLRWDQKYPGIFELTVLDGWPSKVMSNQDDGSYATKDLFELHPTTPNAYRYYARHDDTIVLSNGEKANPLLLEGVARDNRLVAEAIAFGSNKPYLGMFILPTGDPSAREIVDAVWPSLDKANDRVPAYARLSKDMIRVIPADSSYRRTDKDTVIRAAFYKDFASQIDAVYEESLKPGDLVLPKAALLTYLKGEVLRIMRLSDQTKVDTQSDLFSLGMDSLQAMQLRTAIIRHLSTGGETLLSNFVFDHPNMEDLAEAILRLQSGLESSDKSRIEDRMQSMITKYSRFSRHEPGPDIAEGRYVLLTGVTGSLGAHIASQLAIRDDVQKVYCPVRMASDQEASNRLAESLNERQTWDALSSADRRKIVALPADLSKEHLGLSDQEWNEILTRLTDVIHCAWAVNFNLALESFEQSCVAATKNLIDLCLSVRSAKPAMFNFCSSVSAVAASPGPTVPEELPASLSYAQSMGYAQSKLVTEHICALASEQTGLKVRILRVGQIIGDTKAGIWNATEAIPLIFRSAKTIGALPTLREQPQWLPVDVVAAAMNEIALSDQAGSAVMHIVNHQTFHWTKDLLPVLQRSEIGGFEEVDQRTWVARLRASVHDAVANPPIKLLQFFMNKYDREPSGTGLVYGSKSALSHSPALQNAPSLDEQSILRSIHYFETQAWRR